MIGLIALGALAALILLIIFLPVVGWSILGLILLAIVLVLVVPVGADIEYIGKKLKISVKADGFLIQIFPKKSDGKEKPAKEAPKPKPEKPAKEPKPKKELNLDFSAEEIIELLKRVFRGLGKFGKITVNRFLLHYVAAGRDPYLTARIYGTVNAVLSAMAPVCVLKFDVKDDVDVWTDIDFTTETMTLDFALCISLRLIQFVRVGLAIGFGAVGILIKNKLRHAREKRQAKKELKAGSTAET